MLQTVILMVQQIDGSLRFVAGNFHPQAFDPVFDQGHVLKVPHEEDAKQWYMDHCPCYDEDGDPVDDNLDQMHNYHEFMRLVERAKPSLKATEMRAIKTQNKPQFVYAKLLALGSKEINSDDMVWLANWTVN